LSVRRIGGTRPPVRATDDAAAGRPPGVVQQVGPTPYTPPRPMAHLDVDGHLGEPLGRRLRLQRVHQIAGEGGGASDDPPPEGSHLPRRHRGSARNSRPPPSGVGLEEGAVGHAEGQDAPVVREVHKHRVRRSRRQHLSIGWGMGVRSRGARSRCRHQRWFRAITSETPRDAVGAVGETSLVLGGGDSGHEDPQDGERWSTTLGPSSGMCRAMVKWPNLTPPPFHILHALPRVARRGGAHALPLPMPCMRVPHRWAIPPTPPPRGPIPLPLGMGTL